MVAVGSWTRNMKSFRLYLDPTPVQPERCVRNSLPEEQAKFRDAFKPLAKRYRCYWRIAYVALGIGLVCGALLRVVISATLERSGCSASSSRGRDFRVRRFIDSGAELPGIPQPAGRGIRRVLSEVWQAGIAPRQTGLPSSVPGLRPGAESSHVTPLQNSRLHALRCEVG